jgi:hypothetical protein
MLQLESEPIPSAYRKWKHYNCICQVPIGRAKSSKWQRHGHGCSGHVSVRAPGSYWVAPKTYNSNLRKRPNASALNSNFRAAIPMP